MFPVQGLFVIQKSKYVLIRVCGRRQAARCIKRGHHLHLLRGHSRGPATALAAAYLHCKERKGVPKGKGLTGVLANETNPTSG